MNKEKLQEFQELLKNENIDAALLINTTIKDPNVLYWTGLELEYSFLLIQKNKDPLFLVSALEYQRAKKYSKIQQVKEYKKPFEEIAKIIGKNKTIAINRSAVTLALFKGIKKYLKECIYKDVEPLMRKVRIIKTKEEINALEEAARIAGDGESNPHRAAWLAEWGRRERAQNDRRGADLDSLILGPETRTSIAELMEEFKQEEERRHRREQGI